MGREKAKLVRQDSHSEVRFASNNACDLCVVCLEPISERAVASPCNHCSFDFHCLTNWAELRASCPLCNATINHIEYDWRSPDDYKLFVVSASLRTTKTDNRNFSNQQSRPSHRRGRCASRYSRDALQPNLALQRRRYIYSHNLYSLHVGSNRLSQYRDVTPAIFARDKTLQSRARAWIRRELCVFSFLGNNDSAATEIGATRSNNRIARSIPNAEFLLEYIIALLKTIDLRGSAGQAEEMLQEFLHRDHAQLFLHELNAWLRSPYARVEDWDRMIQYRESIPMNYLQERDRSSTVT